MKFFETRFRSGFRRFFFGTYNSLIIIFLKYTLLP